MKKIINKIIFAFIISATVLSCSDADNVIYDVFDGQSYGAVLRKVNITNQNFNLTDPASFFGIVVEEQDEQYGALLSEVKVYADYKDATGLDSRGEGLVKTIPASAFTTSTRGLPTTEIIVTLAEAAAGVGNPTYGVGDVFGVRLELVLTDGRTFSAADTSGSLQGSYFASPYAYPVPILCAPKPGNYRVEMHDSYGDGWQTDDGNGGSGILVTLTDAAGNVSTIEVGMCSPYGAAAGTFAGGPDCTGPASTSFYDATATVAIPATAELAVWSFPGDQYGEISFEIYAPDGTLLFDSGGTGNTGPGLLEVLNCR